LINLSIKYNLFSFLFNNLINNFTIANQNKTKNIELAQSMAELIICTNCNLKIEDAEFVNLDPKFFHIEHFSCKTCRSFFHYFYFIYYLKKNDQMLFGVKCETCQKVIKEQYVLILGKNYHNLCFICFSCKTPFKGVFFSYNQKKPFVNFFER